MSGLTKGESLELAELFHQELGSGREGDMSSSLKHILSQFHSLFEQHKPVFEATKERMLRELSVFLDTKKSTDIQHRFVEAIVHSAKTAFETHIFEIDTKGEHRNARKDEGRLDEYIPEIFLNYFLSHVLEALMDKYLEQFFPSNTQKNPVDAGTREMISNILRDRGLTSLLMGLKMRGLIDQSGNLINKYEVEEELKVININKKKVIGALEKKGATKTFEGVVEDVYYDYPDGHKQLDTKGGFKSTFRIRTKVNELTGKTEHYYTIKRKLSKAEEAELVRTGVLEAQEIKTRRCYEKELKIVDFNTFKQCIERYGFVEVRRKSKKRVAYEFAKEKIKFDFDSYEGYNDMVEIEAEKNSTIKKYLEDADIGLGKYERIVGGSSSFFEDPRTKKTNKK